GTGADLVGRPLTDIVDASSVPEMRSRIQELHEEGDSTPRSHAELLHRDGTSVPVELISVRTTWEGAPAQQVVGRDLSARQEAEAAVSSQAALVRHVSNAIIATDGGGVVTSWNPAAETVYGWPVDEAVGQRV